MSAPRVHPLLHLVPIALIALNVALGVRTLAVQDARLGWGMFSNQMNYQTGYEWVLADGSTRPEAGLDLRGKTKGYLGETRSHRTRYGVGAMRTWLHAYVRHMYRNRRPPDAVAFRATVDYQINFGEDRQLVVTYPPDVDGTAP
jgi:hypothetical protein